MLVGWSKSRVYETPCDVIGISKLTGLKVAPKSICTDRKIGTWKAGNMEVLQPVKC